MFTFALYTHSNNGKIQLYSIGEDMTMMNHHYLYRY